MPVWTWFVSIPAHVSEEGATHIVETVHRVNPAIPIMIDTKGPEIRDARHDEYGNSINFRPGDRVAVRVGRQRQRRPARWFT